MRYAAVLLIAFLLCGCGHIVTAEEMKKRDADMAMCRTAIKEWILAHAVHPESYQPVTFDEFSTGLTLNGASPVPGSETFTLHHTHRMLTNKGDTASYSGYFLLDNEFRVGIIESNRTNANEAGTYPEWQAWTDRFGRPMTGLDSSEWRLRSNGRFLHEMEEVRGKMNTGDAYVVGTSEDSGKAVVDSVIKALR